jgi:hypothetical protein
MIQRHPVDSFDTKVNFWEEFPDYKINAVFGLFWKRNKEAGPHYLEASSKFMWLLALCYDRKSSFFAQPEKDKWEVVGDNLFGQPDLMMDLVEDMKAKPGMLKFADLELVEYIAEFEKSIDTPIGLSLRILEKKLAQRTAFINETDYTMDHFELVGTKNILRKGTADQLDRMFANTDKINGLVLKAMENLKSVEGQGIAKGGGKESLSDGDENF